jgi:hypothetical protein
MVGTAGGSARHWNWTGSPSPSETSPRWEGQEIGETLEVPGIGLPAPAMRVVG